MDDQKTIGDLTGTLAAPQSPLSTTLNEHGNQLDKLHSLLNDLSQKLDHLRLPMPQKEENSENMAEPSHSSTVFQIVNHTGHVKNMQTLVQDLINELEA
jgi:hypothetical protein